MIAIEPGTGKLRAAGDPAPADMRWDIELSPRCSTGLISCFYSVNTSES